MVKLLDIQKITMAHAEEYKVAINSVIESGWFLQGKENQQFEADYARYIGSEHCVAVANGLDALKLILRGYMELGIFHEGDEIIVPANTYIATILAITDNHLTPVLVEPTWEHLEIDIDKIEEAIT
jgi:dTDP-4-amino-4,6-dideoxygalactose transaminase